MFGPLDILDTNKEVAVKKGFDPLPDGAYLAEITGAKIDESKDPARIEFEYTLSEGQTGAGRKAWITYQMTAKGVPFFRADMDKLGLGDIDSSNVNAKLEEAHGKRCEIYLKSKESTVKPGTTYQAVYLNNML